MEKIINKNVLKKTKTNTLIKQTLLQIFLLLHQSTCTCYCVLLSNLKSCKHNNWYMQNCNTDVDKKLIYVNMKLILVDMQHNNINMQLT